MHTLGVMQGFHSLLICFLYTLSLAPVDKQLYYQLMANRKEVWESAWILSSISTPTFCCRKEDPFQGPKVGTCQILRNELSGETHVLTKQEILLGKGAQVE